MLPFSKILPSRLFKPTLILVLALTLLLSVFQGAVPAQSVSQLDARVSRLESENSVLRSQLSQLSSEISRGNRGGVTVTPPRVSSPPTTSNALASDPMFNRLATLVIELRERIIALENRAGIPQQP
jgi:hypothetical protein